MDEAYATRLLDALNSGPAAIRAHDGLSLLRASQEPGTGRRAALVAGASFPTTPRVEGSGRTVLAAITVRVYRPSWTRPADNGVARIPLACDLLGDRTIARLEVLMIVTVLGKVAVGAWTREPAAR
jgi:hypothetical protein